MREHALDIGALAMGQMAIQIRDEQKVKQELKVSEKESLEKGALDATLTQCHPCSSCVVIHHALGCGVQWTRSW